MKRDIAMTGAIRHLKRLLTGGLKVSALYKKAELQNEAQRRRWRHDIKECCSLEEHLSHDAEWMPDQASVTQYPSFTPSARVALASSVCLLQLHTVSRSEQRTDVCEITRMVPIILSLLLKSCSLAVSSTRWNINSNLWTRSQAENSDTAI